MLLLQPWALVRQPWEEPYCELTQAAVPFSKASQVLGLGTVPGEGTLAVNHARLSLVPPALVYRLSIPT